MREVPKPMDAPAPGNVQTHQICIIHKGVWIKIQTDEEHEKVGIKSTER